MRHRLIFGSRAASFVIATVGALAEDHDRDRDRDDHRGDHTATPIKHTLNGPGLCNNGAQQGKPAPAKPLNGAFGVPVWGRCGYGTRMPLLVVSPLAKKNYADHTLTDQTSVLRFVEDNWLNGERIQPGGSFDTIAGTINNMFDFDRDDDDRPRKVILDEATGAVVSVSASRDDHDRDDRH